jgi:hypothetical protein
MLSLPLLPRLSLTLAALAALASAARGGFAVISQPNAGYLASTTKFAVPNSGPDVSSLTAGDLTISLSSPMTPGQAGPGHFVWNNPPLVEDSAPAVLFSKFQASRVLTFSQPLETFGVEMEPNLTIFFPATFTAKFFNGTTLVGTVSKGVSQHGALLFAATDTDTPFTSVQLSTVSSALGFHIGDIRAEVATPEPASLGLFGLGLLGVIGCGRRRAQKL